MIKPSSICIILLSLIMWATRAEANTVQAQPWEKKTQQLQLQRDAIFGKLVEIHSALVRVVGKADPALLARLSLDPPKPRATGYGLLPEVRENAPQVTVVAKQTFYSLAWLEDRLNQALANTQKLADRLRRASDVEPLVAGFEQLLVDLRNLESNLSYHEYWQKAIVRHAAFFHKKNKLMASLREMNTPTPQNRPPGHIAELRRQLVQDMVPFRATRGLELLSLEGGEKVLPVIVCTDIEDPDFLQMFQQGVHEAFTESSAARQQRFSVDLHWRLIGAGALYQNAPPNRGDAIDLDLHRSMFTGCPLILTTGAASTHAVVGDRIVLGTSPISRRALAHEFGHLLGFSDAYLRGYDGEPEGPYGAVLVEWTGLSDDLMGSPGGGQVSDEMIGILFEAYGVAE